MIYASLGTVSESTVNPEHLIPAFARELQSLFKKQSPRWKRGNTRRIKNLLKQCREYEDGLENQNFGDCESCGETRFRNSARLCADCLELELVPELEHELALFAPPYASFGTNEGDGADFGFFPDMETIKEEIRGGSILVQDETQNRLARAVHYPVPKNYTGFFAHISDHGNLSLYQFTRGKQKYIWGVV